MSHDGDPDIRTVASSVIYADSWMSLRRDEIERRDGSRGVYAVVDKPHFALVIPADSGRFCLVEEYRYPVRRRAWAFPQGGWPGGRTGEPEDLARLELAQETGLRARQLTLLGFLHSSHGTVQPGLPRVPGHRADRGRTRPGTRRSRTCSSAGCPGRNSRT